MSAPAGVQAARALAPRTRGWEGLWKLIAREPSIITFVLLVALVILFIAITPDHSFASRPVLQLFLTYAPEIALMTMGMSILLIVGEMDLSIGSIYVFSSVIFAWLNLVYDAPLWAAAIAGLAAGFLMGLVNGLLVAYSGVSSLIITLGTMWGYNAVMNLGIGGRSVPLSPSGATAFLRSALTGQIAGVPMQFVWMLVVAFLLWILLNHTRTGNHIYATGSNDKAARMMGVSVDRVRLFCFALIGLLGGFAGIVSVCRTGVAVPQSGQFTMLLAIAGSVVGGTKLTGGSGSLFGALCGAIILQVLSLGFIQVGLSDYWVTLMTAVAIILTAFAFTKIDVLLKSGTNFHRESDETPPSAGEEHVR